MAVRIAGQRRAGSGLTLIDPASDTAVQPTGRTGYSLVFSDEFAGTLLDQQKWATSYPDTPFWNATQPGGHLTNSNEPEAYDSTGITFPGGSLMRLTCRNQVLVAGLPYTSGMVTSYPSFNPTYGYFEARMRLKDVQDSWPAFWLDPTATANWPAEGEIDIMENFASGSFNSIVQNTLIWGTDRSPTQVAVSTSLELWHTYACEWRPGQVTWYIDGVQSKQLTNATAGVVPTTPHYLICNLAVLPSNNVPASALPFFIDVDYIRAWA